MAPLEAVLVPDDNSSIALSKISKISDVTPHMVGGLLRFEKDLF